jgi:hypothetical protein
MGREHEEHIGSCKDLDIGFDDSGTNLFVPQSSERSIVLLSMLESMNEEKNTFSL